MKLVGVFCNVKLDCITPPTCQQKANELLTEIKWPDFSKDFSFVLLVAETHDMKHQLALYIGISVACFLLLVTVQFVLVRNTYELTNDRFYFAERMAMKESYSRSIKNDKLFPGGAEIIDSFLYRHLDCLQILYKRKDPEFEKQKQLLADSIFEQLRKKESIRRFLNKYKQEKKVTDSLVYALMIESLSISFDSDVYTPIYDKHKRYPLINSSIQESSGIRIGGTLQTVTELNKVNGFSIRGTQRYPYRINFELHVEPHNRNAAILRQMTLTFSLSLLSILIVVILFFVTFRNWVKQKKLSEMKSDFINNITHELHTPLATIIVANKNLQNSRIAEKKENIKALTDVIQRQSDRLKILIGEVLDIVTTNAIALNKKDYQLNDLLDEILLDYRLKMIDANITIVFDKKTEEDTISLDKFHFTTMLLNIFDNAIKYNESNTRKLSVTTQKEQQGNLQILICDNGIGIPRENIRHIFDKFYRGSDQYKMQTKGLGLGLYYVKKIVEAHGWHILVESKPAKGSCFIITVNHEKSAYEAKDTIDRR